MECKMREEGALDGLYFNTQHKVVSIIETQSK